MFAVIRHYHFDKQDSAKIDRAIREEFVPIVQKARGFQHYYWLDNGKSGADESVRLAADYVRERLSNLLTQRPDVIEGPVEAHD
jgi:hypothetical protein